MNVNEDIKQACEVLARGGVILYPTDTVWGIGCDATNPEAVKRVYDIKQRADSKAMLVLVDSEAKVEFYVRDVPPVAWDLIELSTKPLTILYDGDPAGIKASLRGIDLVLEEGMNVKVVLIPDGDDPDSYSMKHTKEEIETFITGNEKDFIDFKAGLLLEEAGDGLMFDGEPLDEETRQLLRASLENQLEMTKRLAKQKFTPKKYRKE